MDEKERKIKSAKKLMQRLVFDFNAESADHNGQQDQCQRGISRQRRNRDFFDNPIANLDAQRPNTVIADHALDFAEEVYAEAE
jgi:hypothetical protein